VLYLNKSGFSKISLKKNYFSCTFRLISASLNEHAQRTRKTKPNYFEYKDVMLVFFSSLRAEGEAIFVFIHQ